MTTRNLRALFSPSSIALIGASRDDHAVGNVVARNLLAGNFSGRIMLVNPRAEMVRGHPCFASVLDLPESPDLAVVTTPPSAAISTIEALGARGCRAAVVITAGFDAAGKQALLDAARPHLMRILGPNGLGFLSPVHGINASFSHLMPLPGGLALLSQSGAIATSIIDWAHGRGIGFSHVLSMGDMADIDFGDLLDFLTMDAATRAILIYAESITSARKFMSAARIAARAKPVIFVKAGRSAAGARAATSHTGALAGADEVYDAAFRRAGMLRVMTLRDLFDAAETLDSGLRVTGDRLSILTNGGGLGVLAADALEAGGGRLATLSEVARADLDTALPPTWSGANPIDIIGDADGARYEAALDIAVRDESSDAVLVMNCPTGVADSADAAAAALRVKDRRPGRAMLGCWMGEATAAAVRRNLSEAGLPTYETPDEAVRAFLRLREYNRNQQALYETPARTLVERQQGARDRARILVNSVIEQDRTILTEPEAKAVLSAYGVPVVQTLTAGSAEEAAAAAAVIDGPVALKILSRQITHKSDVGGVRLNLEGPEAVRKAAQEMLIAVRHRVPEAEIDGFTVQQMAVRPRAQELLLGAVIDPTFGPCILFGHGGVATETIADRIIGLPPLNSVLAGDMIDRTRVSRLLAGYRDRRAADRDAIISVLIALSDLMIDLPQVAELDINPLLADSEGVIALDARVVVRPPSIGSSPLAIRPWPQELSNETAIQGRQVRIRPIRPDDADRLMAFAARTRAEHIQLRFHGAVAAINPATAARLCQIDYDREMVLVAEEPDGAVTGVVRLVFDPDFESAECAIIVRSDAQGHGLGQALLNQALDYARGRGALRVWGDVMSDNTATLDLARRLGAVCQRCADDLAVTQVEFRFGSPG